MSDNGVFKNIPDKGNLHAVQTKTNPLGKDYLSGWKNVSKTSGKTYLALVVDRWIPPVQQAPAPAPKNDFTDDDIPF
jgi:hypothetical protein